MERGHQDNRGPDRDFRPDDYWVGQDARFFRQQQRYHHHAQHPHHQAPQHHQHYPPQHHYHHQQQAERQAARDHEGRGTPQGGGGAVQVNLSLAELRDLIAQQRQTAPSANRGGGATVPLLQQVPPGADAGGAADRDDRRHRQGERRRGGRDDEQGDRDRQGRAVETPRGGSRRRAGQRRNPREYSKKSKGIVEEEAAVEVLRILPTGGGLIICQESS